MKRIPLAWKLMAALAVVLVCIPQMGAENEEKRDPRGRREETRVRRDVPRAERPAAPEARRARGRLAAAAARPVKPRPLVIQFKNISAESFMETLEQLGENRQIGEVLRGLPVAVNEQANAVVAVAPREMGQWLTTIAKGLDRPSEFHERNREREREERGFDLKVQMMRRQVPAHVPTPGPRPFPGGIPGSVGRGGIRRGIAPPRPGRREAQKHKPGAGIARKEPHAVRAAPMAHRFWSLITPSASKELHLSDGQHGKIKSMLQEAREQEMQLIKRIAEERATRLRQLRKRIFESLEPEQRHAAERWLQRREPKPHKGPTPQPKREDHGHADVVE